MSHAIQNIMIHATTQQSSSFCSGMGAVTHGAARASSVLTTKAQQTPNEQQRTKHHPTNVQHNKRTCLCNATNVPVKSDGTRNFLLSMSGIELLDTFSTTTWQYATIRCYFYLINFTFMFFFI